jgi:hypothetical protein
MKKRIKPAEKSSTRTRKLAQQEVVWRGTVQFRLDEETMLRLMKIADEKKTPLGVLVRLWTVERLIEEERKASPRSLVD